MVYKTVEFTKFQRVFAQPVLWVKDTDFIELFEAFKDLDFSLSNRSLVKDEN